MVVIFNKNDMKKNAKRKFYMMLTCSVIMFLSCKQTDFRSEVVTINDNDAVEVNFEDVAKNVRVVPLKSDSLLYGCYEMQCYGNDIFILGDNSKIIYYFHNDSLKSVLEEVGRGPGEYINIGQFTYDTEEKMLYVISLIGNEILWYSVPDMKFCGKTTLSCNVNAFMVHDKNTFLISCDTDSSYVLDLIDKTSGKVIKHIQTLSVYAYNACNRTLLGYSHNNNTLSVLGTENVVYSIGDNMVVDTLIKYGFGDKNYPEKYINPDVDDITILSEYLHYISSDEYNDCLRGGYFMRMEDDGLSFWYSTAKPSVQKDYMYYRCSDSDTLNLKGFKVPGLKYQIAPKCITDDGYAAVFEGIADNYIDPDTEPSPLAKQIIKAMDAQRDENPVLVYFDIK